MSKNKSMVSQKKIFDIIALSTVISTNSSQPLNMTDTVISTNSSQPLNMTDSVISTNSSQPLNMTDTGFDTYKSCKYLSHPDYWSITIYYPKNGDALPVLAMAPGLFGGKRHLKPWAEYLASNGIVTVSIEMRSIFCQPNQRAKALLGALDVLENENKRIESPLYNRIDTNAFGVSGGSMGGGGALLASKMRPSLKAAFCAVPWLSECNAPKDIKDIVWEGSNVPTLIVGGELDKTAKIVRHANIQYDNLKGPKMKVILKDMEHDAGCWPQQCNNDIGKIVLNWLKYYLKNDTSIFNDLVIRPIGVKDFDYELSDSINGHKEMPDNETFVKSTNPMYKDNFLLGYLRSYF